MSKKRTKNKPPANLRQQKPEQQPQNELLVHGRQEQYIFQGPLPSPRTLEQYNQIVPDAGERILQMAEKDAAFQHEITHKAIDTEAKERKRGQIFGMCIGLAALAVTGLALVLGYSGAASIIGGTTVLGLVTVFVTGQKMGSGEKIEPVHPDKEPLQ